MHIAASFLFEFGGALGVFTPLFFNSITVVGFMPKCSKFERAKMSLHLPYVLFSDSSCLPGSPESIQNKDKNWQASGG